MAEKVAVVCRKCGRLSRDVYYRAPGSGNRTKKPICADCYELGWMLYWRNREEKALEYRPVGERRTNRIPDEDEDE